MRKLIIFGFGLLISISAKAQEVELPTAYFEIGGYAKADALITTYFNGQPAPQSPIKDIHIPSAIPIGPLGATHDTYFHAKESRVHFDIGGKINGKQIRTYLEIDFLLSKAGDERVSNSYNPRLRELFIEYDNLIVGQTWSNFMVLILPDDLDFIGAAEGMVFNRQPQIRLTFGEWRFSLENPQAFITPNGGGDFIASTGGLPDITARKDFNESWGTLSIATIARTIRIRDDQNKLHFSPGFGLTLGSRIRTGQRNDLRFMFTAGNGLGRYVGIAFVNAGVLDSNYDINLIGSVNGYIAYLHHWTENWKSSFNISGFMAMNNTELGGFDQNRYAWSASGNLLYQVSPELLFGGEIMAGYRDQESLELGSFLRFQFSAKYNFRYRAYLAN